MSLCWFRIKPLFHILGNMLFDRACEKKRSIFIRTKPFLVLVSRLLVPVCSSFDFTGIFCLKIIHLPYKMTSHSYLSSNIEAVGVISTFTLLAVDFTILFVACGILVVDIKNTSRRSMSNPHSLTKISQNVALKKAWVICFFDYWNHLQNSH